MFTRITPARTSTASPARPPAMLEFASPASLALLGEVLARLTGTERPVVQFVAAAPDGQAGQVARDFAAAAATRFGRTLLVSSAACAAREEAGVRGLSWLMTGTLGGEPDGIVPDTYVAGLYYTSLALDRAGPLEVPVAAWLAGPQAFRMIVIDCPAVAADPRTLAVSPLCHGSVLAVQAGLTTLPQLRAASRQLASTGVPLLGTVLYEAPSIGRAFRRRTG